MPPGSTNRVKVDNFEDLTGVTQVVSGDVRITNGALIVDVLNLTNSHPLTVAIVDGSGSQITSFGGGTQYTEDAAAAANPVGTVPILIRADTPGALTTTDGDNVGQRGTDYGAAYVTLLDTGGSPVAVGGGTQYTEGDTDASITGTAMLWEDAADTLRSVSAAKPLPVNVVAGGTSGTEYTEGDTDASIAGGAIMWEDAADTLRAVSAAKPLPVGDAGGSLTVDGTFWQATQPVSGTFWQATQPISGTVTANMGTVTADPFGANADAASATGSISAKLRFIASTGIPITGTVTVGSHAVTVASGGIASGAVASGAIASGAVASGAIASGAVASGAYASGSISDGAVVTLGAKTDAKSTATDATSITAMQVLKQISASVQAPPSQAVTNTGTFAAQAVIRPETSGGLTTFMATGADGSSILVATKQTIKNSAGQLYGYYFFNPEAATTFVHIYNTDTVTVGTTNPQLTFAIPAGAAANVTFPIGVAFSTAMSTAATTTAGGNTAPSTGVSAIFWYA